jgi:hypothetical protein
MLDTCQLIIPDIPEHSNVVTVSLKNPPVSDPLEFILFVVPVYSCVIEICVEKY